MTRTRPLLTALTAGAIASAGVLAAASPVGAQAVPFTAYGVGLEAGQLVAAYNGDELCAETTVDADGNWLLHIAMTDPCAPTDGDELSFTLDGQPTEHDDVEWKAGGAPEDIEEGIELEVVESEDDDDTSSKRSGKVPFGHFVRDLVQGTNVAVWAGGDIEQLIDEALRQAARSIWKAVQGRLVGFVPGAPEFLNQDFVDMYPDGQIPADSPFLVVAE